MNAYFGRMYVYSDRDGMIKIPFSVHQQCRFQQKEMGYQNIEAF